MEHSAKEIIIVGAGVSGLLLAQYLRKSGIPFRIFERDADLTVGGGGWGLTLHWSLPALRSLLPEDLVQRLPETYVNRAAVDKGQSSTFPFFNLSTGELKAATPVASEAQRIRVSRDRFRRLLATGIDVQWGKVFSDFESGDDSITVNFEDGSACLGSLVKIPIRLMGIRIEYSPAEMEPMQRLDPIFLQGTASENDTYVFFSILDAPGSPKENQDKYVCQIAVSWPVRDGFFGAPSPIPFPSTAQGGVELVKRFATTWAEPFRSLVGKIPENTDIKFLELYDWTPPKDLRGAGRVALVGDAFHPMAMYRGEGANHAFVDVLDFAELVVPPLTLPDSGVTELRAALDDYEDAVTARSRPAVLASRQACMDAHEWGSISSTSPLLSRRVMRLDFERGVE
ncbi:hypothetical protein B0T25DRAFT_574885 [Lasiosphaeria hispida]|uniref:FAD-binding domain-containing protein n=1 Tax=Lasiosphaeria hispida TaxID=260671 RepID=A0AAJ0H5J3_9PEZI|nr:hypothetical protein B0T25DRAFT_574885 [Lasiosphaeria hispida]